MKDALLRFQNQLNSVKLGPHVLLLLVLLEGCVFWTTCSCPAPNFLRTHYKKPAAKSKAKSKAAKPEAEEPEE